MLSKLCWKNEFLSLSHRFADRTAIHDAAGPTSYRSLFEKAAGVTKAVLDAGARPGMPVATYLSNDRNAVAASYGIVMSGAAETALNHHLAPDDVRYCLQTADCSLVVTDTQRANQLREFIPDATFLTVDTIAEFDPMHLPEIWPDATAPGKILFTSGTTGKPKGIVHSQFGRWLGNLALRATLPAAPDTNLNLLLLTPFSHGSSLLTYAYLDIGASITLLDGLDVGDCVERILRGGVNQIFAPPTVLAKLMDGIETTDLADGRFKGAIRTIFCGTAPLSVPLYQRVRETFGPVVRLTYGKTEIFNPITVLTPEETDNWFRTGSPENSTCVGWPGPGVEIHIEESAPEDPRSESPTVEQHHTDRPEPRTGPVLIRARHQYCGTLAEGFYTPHDADAFHRSGDIGFVDDRGRLHLTGREANIIKTGGYRVGAEEVEEALRPALPRTDFAIVGLPSAYWGEIITAVAATDDEDWSAAASDRLATLTRYKRPRLFACLSELPRNSIGKVVRQGIIDAVMEKYDLEDGSHPRLTVKIDE